MPQDAQVASVGMERGDPFAFGDFFDDSDGPDDEGMDHRGWIAPEDRLWRHPSELSSTENVSTNIGRLSPRMLWRERRASIAVGTLGAAAVAATAAMVLTLVDVPPTGNVGSARQVNETSFVTMPSAAVSAATGIMQMVSALRPSLVELEPAGSRRPASTGVVLPGGELVVTAASSTTGVSRVNVITSAGRQLPGRVIASDKRSGVAVVSTTGRLVPASFGSESVMPGQFAVTAGLESGSSSQSVAETEVAVGTVQQVGIEVSSGEADGLMDSIEVETPSANQSGGVLLDARGNVIGILDGDERAGTDTVGIFVPAPLALGVADELASAHRVDHGWIGVDATDAPGYAGAEVESVFAGSPAAAAGIEPGDIVTAIDFDPVISHADLQARLYTIAPGSTVELTVVHSGITRVVSMVLASYPGD